MQKIAVCVSGGGTNLQAIIDKVADGTIKNTEIAVVISNKKDAFALERAKSAGIPAEYIGPKDFATERPLQMQCLRLLISMILIWLYWRVILLSFQRE